MTIQLQAEVRTKFGKAARGLRAQGLIPAELYGHGLKNAHLSVAVKDFEKAFRSAGENTVIEISVNKEKHPAIIHEVKKNFVSGQIEHIDFYQVRMDEAIKVHVPVELVGESPAVKEKHGMINLAMGEIEIEALPGNIPQKFVVDISGLAEFGQSIYVRDIEEPKGAKIKAEPESVVVSVMAPVKEEEIAVAPVADVSAVKVESEEKKAERDKEKESQS